MTRMKQTLVLLAMVFMIVSCAGVDDHEDPDSPRGVTATSIKIGTHTDLTGPLASWGVPLVNGMRMRFAELEAAGGVHGRTIDYVVEDTRYQVPVAVKAVNRLLDIDGVFATLGSMGTPHNNATFSRLFEASVPSLFRYRRRDRCMSLITRLNSVTSSATRTRCAAAWPTWLSNTT